MTGRLKRHTAAGLSTNDRVLIDKGIEKVSPAFSLPYFLTSFLPDYSPYFAMISFFVRPRMPYFSPTFVKASRAFSR